MARFARVIAVNCARDWLRKRKPGSGRAPQSTAERQRLTDGWRWKSGKSDGILLVGRNISPPEKPNRKGRLSGSIRTPGARWGPRSLSMNSKRKQRERWLPGKEAAPQSWPRMNGKASYLLCGSGFSRGVGEHPVCPQVSVPRFPRFQSGPLRRDAL
jgi:hypothetical protein